MKLQLAKNALTSRVVRQTLLARKNSPAVLFTAGVVGMVTTTVLASKATLGLSAVLDEHDETMKKVQKAKDIVSSPNWRGEAYDEDAVEKDYRIIKIQTAIKVGKLYAPAVAVGLVSVACLTGAHVALTKRNTALMAAYAALERGFSEYRERVALAVGDEREKEIRWNGKANNYKDVEGQKYRAIASGLPGNMSIYARLWDRDTSSSWNEQSEYNLAFITSKQNYLNDKLKARGHVMLNDAYDELGLERTKAGCVTGWVKGHGDDYIDFGVFSDDAEGRALDFIMGRETGVWMDFNVDGIVYDLI